MAIQAFHQAVVARKNAGGGGFVMPANLVASFYAGNSDFTALANGAAATGYVDTFAGSTWTTAAGTITKETFRGMAVLDVGSTAIYRCGSVFDSSFDTALTVVYISLADTAGSNQTCVSNGGIFSGLALCEQFASSSRFNQWFGKTSPTGSQYGAAQVVTYRYDGAKIYLNRNGYEAEAVNTGNLGLSGNLDIGAASFSFDGKVRLVLVFNRVLSDLEVASLVSEFGPLSQGFAGNNVIMCIGDSQTGTTGGSGAVTYPSAMRTDLEAAPYQFNYIWTNAQSGWKLADMEAGIPANVEPFVSTPNTSEREIAIIFGGTNNITSGDTGAQTISAFDSLKAALDLVGFTNYVLVTTLTTTSDGANPSWVTNRDIYNAYLESLAIAGVIEIVVVADIPELADPSDLTYFNADGVHLNDAGKTILGNAISDAVQLFA